MTIDLDELARLEAGIIQLLDELRQARADLAHLRNIAGDDSCAGYMARATKAEAERDEARAERDRLLKLFDDAGQGEHNVLALVDHYQSELLAAEDERDRLRDGRAVVLVIKETR